MSTPQPSLPEHVVEFIRQTRSLEHPESYLIAVLQKVQTAFGYLPRAAMDEVSQRMEIPAAQVTGVATFYHFFSFKPKGRHTITPCMGTACFVRGAARVLDKFKEMLNIQEGETTPDGEFSIDCARCLGACALAPVVVVDGRVFGNVQPRDVPGILREYGFTKK